MDILSVSAYEQKIARLETTIDELETELTKRKHAIQVLFDEYHDASSMMQGHDAWDVATAAYHKALAK